MSANSEIGSSNTTETSSNTQLIPNSLRVMSNSLREKTSKIPTPFLLLAIPFIVLSVIFVEYNSGTPLTWHAAKGVGKYGLTVLIEIRKVLRAFDFMVMPVITYLMYLWQRHQSTISIEKRQFRSLVKFELLDEIPCGDSNSGKRRLDITALFQRTISDAMYQNAQLLMLIKDGCQLTTIDNPFVQCVNKKQTWLVTNALTNHFLEVLNPTGVMLRSFSRKSKAECFVFALTNIQKNSPAVYKMRCYLVKESTLRDLKFGRITFGKECSNRTTFKTALSILKKMADLYDPPMNVDMTRKDQISPHKYILPPGFGRFWLNSPVVE
jgi:hypothetical protein